MEIIMESNKIGEPDVEVDFDIEDDEDPALFIRITDVNGDQVAEYFTAHTEGVERFFRDVAALKSEWDKARNA